MAYVKRCERCGVIFGRREGSHLDRTEYRGLTCVESDFDLCTDCAFEFSEFMRGVKPKNLLERLKKMLGKED